MWQNVGGKSLANDLVYFSYSSFLVFNLIAYLCSMEWNIVHIAETDSTNRWLREQGQGENMVVWADYQTSGRGQGTNHWESERGKNLTFSMLIHPKTPSLESRIIDSPLPASRQFYLSMVVSLAICDALGQHIGDLAIKWPNDIYWRDAKICGILIENRLKGSTIIDSIVGIGLNVNQREFLSDAPNPVSICQLCEHETDCEQLLKDILQSYEKYIGKEVGAQYRSMLYRKKGFYPYADQQGVFMAELVDVEDSGHLILRDDNGQQRRYAFKEVAFI